MKRFSEQFYKKSEAIKLSLSEKQELRERLVSYMEYHPLPASEQVFKIDSKKATTKAPFMEAFQVWAIPFKNVFKSSAVAVVFILVVLPFMAEKAVPGDSLYAVKVQFNEELRSTFIFDSYQKVEWETERLNRRIAEARVLASEGRLTDAVEVEVAEAVLVHAQNVKREIDGLRKLDADEAMMASISLETTLEVQSNSFKNTKNQTLENPDGITEEFLGRDSLISGALEASRQQTDNLTDEEKVLPSFDKLMARVEINTTRLFELKDGLRGVIADSELGEINRRTEDISRSIQEATLLSEEDLPGAQEQLVDVLQRTQKLITYISELAVKETIDIETLVPVVLTPEEKTQKIDTTLIDLKSKVEQIESGKKQIEEADVLEKVDYSLDGIADLVVQLEAVKNDFDQFMPLAIETTALVNDTLLLVEKNSTEIIVKDKTIEGVVEGVATSSDSEILPEEPDEVETE